VNSGGDCDAGTYGLNVVSAVSAGLSAVTFAIGA